MIASEQREEQADGILYPYPAELCRRCGKRWLTRISASVICNICRGEIRKEMWQNGDDSHAKFLKMRRERHPGFSLPDGMDTALCARAGAPARSLHHRPQDGQT